MPNVQTELHVLKIWTEQFRLYVELEVIDPPEHCGKKFVTILHQTPTTVKGGDSNS